MIEDPKRRSDWLHNIWSAIGNLMDRVKRLEKKIETLEDSSERWRKR